MIKTCLICGSAKIASFLNFGLVSPSSQSFFDVPTQIPKKNLDLWFCDDCYHIQNSAFDGYFENHYGKNYIIGVSHSAHARAIYTAITHRILSELPLSKDARVVEIGCGDGAFLAEFIKQSGIQQGFAYEPSGLYELAKTKPGLKVENRTYSDHEKKGPPVDFLISRHVFEHLKEPHRILDGVKAKILYLEVPRIEYALENSMYAEFYYDHIHYFTRSSFGEFLYRSGYEIISSDVAPVEEFMGVLARPTKTQTTSRVASQKPKYREFANNWVAFRNELSEEIDRLRHSGEHIAIWGAGARGVTLIDNLKLGKDSIEIIVDSDPQKWSKYLPNSSWQVMDPETFYRNPTSVVLVTSATYADEICRALMSRMGPGKTRIFTTFPFREITQNSLGRPNDP
jgi:hypothetical protein